MCEFAPFFCRLPQAHTPLKTTHWNEWECSSCVEDIAAPLITTFPCALLFSATSSHDSQQQPAYTHSHVLTHRDTYTTRHLQPLSLFTVAVHWCSDAPQNSPSCSAPRVSDSRRDGVGDEESMKVWWDSNLPTSQTQTELIHDGWYLFDSTKDKEVNNTKQQQKNKRKWSMKV